MFRRVSVGDASVDVMNWADIVERLPNLVKSGGVIAAVNPEKCLAAARDLQLSAFLRDATVLIPDGMGVVLTLRAMGFDRASRVAGCDLALELCRTVKEVGGGVFLVGADEASSKAAAQYLEHTIGSVVVGRRNGFGGVSDMDALVSDYARSGASVMLVAMGSPRQERYIAELLRRDTLGLFMGVGGTFDVWGGKTVRAPLGWQKLGLEWLYRLLREPRRFGRQVRLGKYFFTAVGAVRKARARDPLS